MYFRIFVQIWNQIDNNLKSRLADIEIKRAVISKLTNHFSDASGLRNPYKSLQEITTAYRRLMTD